jgi:hypothetical protein
MQLKKILAAAALCGAAFCAHAQIDPARGGPVTTMATNPTTYQYVSWLLAANATATTRYFPDFYALNSASPSNVELVDDPAGSGKKVFHLKVAKSDPLVLGGARTEISPRNEYVKEGVRWYTFSMYLPGDWVFHNSPTLVAQLHTSQSTAVVSPPASLTILDHTLSLDFNYNHRSTSSATDPATKANSVAESIRLGNVELNKWYCFVVRANWSYKPGTGEFQVWMNGNEVFNAKNTYNSYETWLGNYAKIGLYMPGTMMVPTRHIYADFVNLGGPQSTFDTMMARTPCAK